MVNVRAGIVIAACSFSLVSCSHGSGAPSRQPAAIATAAATAAASMKPGAPVKPAASQPVTPATRPSATTPLSPAPIARLTPHATTTIPRLPPDAAPRILAVAISKNAVQPGDRVSGSVLTSSNVASVEARIGGYAVSLQKIGVGRFAFTYTVGPLPWFIHGNFKLQVIARNTRGDAVRRTIPLTVR
jgi:hypothetical protein